MLTMVVLSLFVLADANCGCLNASRPCKTNIDCGLSSCCMCYESTACIDASDESIMRAIVMRTGKQLAPYVR